MQNFDKCLQFEIMKLPWFDSSLPSQKSCKTKVRCIQWSLVLMWVS